MRQWPNDCFFAWVESEINAGRSVRFRMKGGSMLPFLREGRDEVVVFPCREDELQPMEAVLFRYRGRHILHRIIRRQAGRLWLQGDGVCAVHEECAPSDVVGIVRYVYVAGRREEVSSWRWRWKVRLWRCLGSGRSLVLRCMRRCG